VEVTRAAADGTQTVVAWLDDGDHFGEVGLLHDVPRNATVRTLSECNCLVLDREKFRGLVARVPRLRDELVRRMSSRVSVTTPPVTVPDAGA
jgi:ATP-binding cassette subfamily B protein